MLPAPTKCLDEINELLPVLGHEKVTKLLASINEATSVLGSKIAVSGRAYYPLSHPRGS